MRELFVHFQKKLLARRLTRPIALCLVLYTMLRWRWTTLAERTCAIAVCTTATWPVSAEVTATWRTVAARADAQLCTLWTVAIAAHSLVFARRFPRRAIGLHDFDVIVFVVPRLRNGFGELGHSSRRNADMGFIRGNTNGANVVLGHAATTAQ
jgi:hypothetical protein